MDVEPPSDLSDGFSKMVETRDRRIAELEAFADRVHGLALAGQADLEEHELAEVNGRLVEIAEAAVAAKQRK